DGGALADLSFLADDPADAVQLVRHFFISLNDVIEGIGNLTSGPIPVQRETGRKVPLFQGGKGGEQLSGVNVPIGDGSPLGAGGGRGVLNHVLDAVPFHGLVFDKMV